MNNLPTAISNDPLVKYLSLSSGAIAIITIAIMAVAILGYFTFRQRKSKLLISWSIITMVAVLLPIILVISNGYKFTGEQIDDGGLSYNVWNYGWMLDYVSTGGSTTFTFSIPAIVAISLTAVVTLTSLGLFFRITLVERNIWKVSKYEICIMGVILAFAIFVLLFIFAGPIFYNDGSMDVFFKFWNCRGSDNILA